MTWFNFDIILDKQTRSYYGERSIRVGGNKEYTDTLMLLAKENRRMLEEIGRSCAISLSLQRDLRHDESDKDGAPNSIIDSHVEERLKGISQKVVEIYFQTRPPYLSRKSIIEGYGESWDKHSKLPRVKGISETSEIETLEKILADEISFLYYVSMRDHYNFMVFEVTPVLCHLFPTNLPRPRELLLTVLKDEEIRKWFSAKLSDIRTYHEQSTTMMREFYDTASLRPVPKGRA